MLYKASYLHQHQLVLDLVEEIGLLRFQGCAVIKTFSLGLDLDLFPLGAAGRTTR